MIVHGGGEILEAGQLLSFHLLLFASEPFPVEGFIELELAVPSRFRATNTFAFVARKLSTGLWGASDHGANLLCGRDQGIRVIGTDAFVPLRLDQANERE